MSAAVRITIGHRGPYHVVAVIPKGAAIDELAIDQAKVGGVHRVHCLSGITNDDENLGFIGIVHVCES